MSKKYKIIWYDQNHIIQEDMPIIADSEDDARSKAYNKYNGNPPGPLLYLEEINK